MVGSMLSRALLFINTCLARGTGRGGRGRLTSSSTSYCNGLLTIRRSYCSSENNIQPHFQSQHVGFIGIGNMGSHMANSLIKAGYRVVVHDKNHNVMEKFAKNGASIAQSPSEISRSCDVVITMLPSASHVLDVYTGIDGLLHEAESVRPWLFIDSSTVDPQTSRSLSTLVSKYALGDEKGCADSPIMLDAPVSGGVLGAQAGTLTFMVGGLQQAYLAAKPLFLSMGKNSIYCGASGNGSAAKICNKSSNGCEYGWRI